MRARFIERTLASLISASEYAGMAEQMAFQRGVLQRVDPRVKVAGLFGLVVVAAASRELRVIGCLFFLAIVLAWLSRVSLSRLLGWVWTPVCFFTGAIALPAIFVTPGRPVAEFAGIFITVQGLHSAAFLLSRAETAATLWTQPPS